MEMTMKKVHFTLQGKGGVGKSYISSLLAQFHRERGEDALCIDTDPVNATFSGYRAFDVRRIELMNGSQLDERQFDAMMEQILNEDRHFVIDNGASSFIPLSNYLIENNAIEMIADAGKAVIIHTVITGGQALMDTLGGFRQLVTQMPGEAAIVIWLNEFFGPIEADGKGFETMKVYTQHKDRVAGILRLQKQTGATFGKDVEQMLEQKLTFADAVQSPGFGLMSKQRLAMVRRTMFDQLATVI
jgi:hypothetical protein